MKTVMNHSQGGGLLKIIRRTNPVTNWCELGHVKDQLNAQYGGWSGMYGILISKMLFQGIDDNDFDKRIDGDLEKNKNLTPY